MFEGFTAERVDANGVSVNLVHGGAGSPLLLLHGYPQTHVMWHRVAPVLAERFTVVVPDLRGYGDSSKPPGGADHAAYSKRAMAQDQVEVMRALGHERFAVAGHDRGGRVAYRLARDHPNRVTRLAVLDIVPTDTVYASTSRELATAYFHWFFLIQPFDLPERLIGCEPVRWLHSSLGGWGTELASFDPDAVREYERCFADPAAIHASCEDYRAGASIDLVHDGADHRPKLACPLLVLWGTKGAMHAVFDVLATWRDRGGDVQGRALDCGHFLPEELPGETAAELVRFLS